MEPDFIGLLYKLRLKSLLLYPLRIYVSADLLM